MTFKEFRATLGDRRGFFVVTGLPHNHESNEPESMVLEWEPSNSKWYKPKEWGREEFGYCDIAGESMRILHIRPLIV